MDARTAGHKYTDFDPTINWALEDASDTLLIYLPGFKKEQLKVQISSAGNLRVMGERQVSGNQWSRFHKELPILSNYDSNKIGAKFDNGILHVKFPKTIIPAEPRKEAKPAVQPTKPPEPTPTAEPQKTGQNQDTKEPPKADKAPEKAPAKPTEEEKKPKKSTEDEEKPKEVKEESKKADEAKIGQEPALQQKKREDLAEKKVTEKDQKRGDTADIGKKMGKTGTKNAGDIGKPKAENYKENAGGSIAKLKKPRNLMNTLLAALLIVVLGLYVKYALRYLGTTKSDPEL